MFKVIVLVSLTSVFIHSTLCEDTRWPNTDGFCPVDQLLNATCKCDDNEDEKKLSCVSNLHNLANGNQKPGNYQNLRTLINNWDHRKTK